MLVVKVELWSAITGEKSEIARIALWNTGAGTRARGDYEGVSYVGRDAEALEKAMRTRRVSKHGTVLNHARLQEHVWNLIAKTLQSMGYGNAKS